MRVELRLQAVERCRIGACPRFVRRRQQLGYLRFYLPAGYSIPLVVTLEALRSRAALNVLLCKSNVPSPATVPLDTMPANRWRSFPEILSKPVTAMPAKFLDRLRQFSVRAHGHAVGAAEARGAERGQPLVASSRKPALSSTAPPACTAPISVVIQPLQLDGEFGRR